MKLLSILIVLSSLAKCHKLYLHQGSNLGKDKARRIASPITRSFDAVTITGSYALKGAKFGKKLIGTSEKKKNSRKIMTGVGGFCGILSGATVGAVRVALSPLEILRSAFDSVNEKRALKRGSLLESVNKNKDSTQSDMYLVYFEKMNRKFPGISKEKLYQTIKKLNDMGTQGPLCPKGLIYANKGDFNTIIAGFTMNTSYRVPEKIYQNAKIFSTQWSLKKKDEKKERNKLLNSKKDRNTAEFTGENFSSFTKERKSNILNFFH